MDTEKRYVDLSLSIKPDKEPIISEVQKEIIKEDLDSLGALKENDINISTLYLFDMGDKLEASIFIRNGLKNNINFDKVPLKLLDSKNKVIVSKVFNLREVSTIPARSARPWKIYFEKNLLKYDVEDLKHYKVIFDNNIKAISTVETELENKYSGVELNGDAEKFVEGLRPLQNGEVDLNIYNVNVENENKIVISLLVRNGSDKQIEVKKLPITIYDSNNKIIMSNSIQLENLKVDYRKARIYNIVFNFDKEKYIEYDFKNLSVSLKGVENSER